MSTYNPCGEPVDVFNIATADGTLFADGVLCSNCDCLRYMIYSVERTHGASITSVLEKAYIDDKRSINLKRGGSRMASRVQMNRTKTGAAMSIGNRLGRQEGWFLKK